MTLKLGMQHWRLKLYKVYINGDSELTITYFTARSNLVVCTFEWEKLLQDDDSTVSSILSGLESRSFGLNTLGTTLFSASSQLVQVVCPRLPGFNQY